MRCTVCKNQRTVGFPGGEVDQIHLPTQGTWVWSLMQEIPHAIKPMRLESVLCNKRNPAPCNQRKPSCSNEDPVRPINT